MATDMEMTHISSMAWGPKDASGIRKDVIVFDGDCVLCSRMAATVHRADPGRVFSLTDMNAPVGQALAKRFGVNPENPETVIVIQNGRALFKTDAAFAIARTLPGWRWFAWLRFFPRWLRDPPYDIIARNRYRWFGRKKSCALADPALRVRIVADRGELE